MNKTITVWITAAVICCGCSRKAETTPVFETSVVERGDIVNSITSTGTVEPVNSVDVGTQVSGIIEKIYVDFNSEVKAGQVIAELDRTTLEADLKSCSANLASSKAELVYQEANYKRIKSLYESGVMADTDMEQAQYAYDKAKAAMNKAEADYSRVKKNLSYATIYSPISGIVLYRAVEEGQTVASSFNTPTLFTIAQDLKKMRVIANVDEADIGNVKEGQKATFTVDAYPDDQFDGTVSQVRLQATTTSNVVTYEVIITAPNEDLKLKPGLTANITIITEAVYDVLTVPNQALTFKPELPEPPADAPAKAPALPRDGQRVFVKNAGDLRPVPVETGMTNGFRTEIRSGIGEGDTVVTAQNADFDPMTAIKKQGSPFMPQRPGGKRR
ncbi:MAG: efflux RND transporter periplasmic adaptor subunit [Paludibacteraceae bacterium]|nr:efflux RND transporter periplasmic adaptor subunit [Paludibacteraceae bacterium]